MNCFQIVSLTLEPQLGVVTATVDRSCELLSDCIFDIGTTTQKDKAAFECSCELLSDCIFDIGTTTLQRLLVQPCCCELLSDCIFDIGTTTKLN